MTNELIKDKGSFDPIKLASPILVEDHHILHKWWVLLSGGKVIGGWTKDDVFEAHGMAALEMTARGLGIDPEGKHATPLTQEIPQTHLPRKKKKPYVSEEAVKEDKHIDEFHKMCLQEASEEFDFALSNGWILPNMIPDLLTPTAHAELRNKNSFILKKTLGSKAIICLRAEDNSITSEKLVELR